MSQANDGGQEQKSKLITFEDGVVTLAGEEVPGILRSLRVDGKVRFDEQKVDGSSGKKKTPQGFEDSDITISLYLVTDEDSSCYDKLETLSGMFRKVDDKANPQIYTVANRHLLARGVRQVVFSKSVRRRMTGRMKSWSRWALWSTTRPWSRRKRHRQRRPPAKNWQNRLRRRPNRPPEPKEDELIITAE